MARILIAEDSRSIRAVLGTLLPSRGFEVEMTKDGKEALDYLVGGGQADLLLTDVDMPGMDGNQLIREMTARRYSMPIVVFSCVNGYDESLGEAYKGPIESSPKPFDNNELVAQITRLTATA
tara:strand:+ start:3229 stop:3594 length:366 start_codon:yes stop_codon:yes gene_type:complete